MPHPGAGRSCARPALMLAVLLALLGLPGCALFRKYDMAQIHQESAARPGRNPVIVIHGFVGSKLRNGSTHESVWGHFVNAITRSKTDDLALPIDRLPITDNRDDLVPYALYEKVAGVKFYGAMLDALRTVGGYRVGDINNPAPDDTCFVYIYDWRRDNAESAAGLGRAILQIKARLHAPDLKFDIVAHSMGGLVALYYMKYGTEDVLSDGREHAVTWAGVRDLGRVVLVGAPLRGTMAAFRLLNTGLSRSMAPAEVFSMPSIYQLLPDDGRGHIVDPLGQPLDIDLYDADAWVRYGWSVFGGPRAPRRDVVVAADDRGARHDAAGGVIDVAADSGALQRKRFLVAALDRARAFRTALDRGTGEEPPVPVHVFGSDCIPTLDRAVLKEGPAGPVTLFDDEATPDRSARRMEALLRAPGDGTVTATSLLGLNAVASTFFICETHGLLPANRGFQDNLFYVLLHASSQSASAARSLSGK